MPAKYPAAPPRTRPTIARPIAAPVPLMTTAPRIEKATNIPNAIRKPKAIGMNLEPAKARARPLTIAMIPINFKNPRTNDKLTAHPAAWSI